MTRTTRKTRSTVIRALGLAMIAALTLGAQTASATLPVLPNVDNSCNGAFQGRPPGSLVKSAARDGVALENNAVVAPGDVVEFTFTWKTTDWIGPVLDKLMDCFMLNGLPYDALEASFKPTANDGIETHTITIPDLKPGDMLCDRARLSGIPASSNPSSTQKSNSICLVVGSPNEREPGRISISKRTIPEGAADKFGFTGKIVAQLADGETAALVVPAGTYEVSEDLYPSWKLVGIDCDDQDSTGNVDTRTATFKVAPGESVHCVFTNKHEGSTTTGDETPGDDEPGDKDPGDKDPGDKDPTPGPKVLGDREPLPKTGVGVAALLVAAAGMLAGGVTLRRIGRRDGEEA